MSPGVWAPVLCAQRMCAIVERGRGLETRRKETLNSLLGDLMKTTKTKHRQTKKTPQVHSQGRSSSIQIPLKPHNNPIKQFLFLFHSTGQELRLRAKYLRKFTSPLLSQMSLEFVRGRLPVGTSHIMDIAYCILSGA